MTVEQDFLNNVSSNWTAGIVILVLVVLTAGCIGGGLSDSSPNTSEDGQVGDDSPATSQEDANGGTPETPEEDQASGDGDRIFPRLKFWAIDRQNNGSGAVVEGKFGLRLLPGDNRTFDDVVVCLYDNQGTVLYENTTSLTGPIEWKNISIRTNESPVYLIVDHPEFSEIEDFVHRYIVIDDMNNNEYMGRDPPPFEYPRHNETGRCR